jgi:phage N-6-adenine-methyltransferase
MSALDMFGQEPEPRKRHQFDHLQGRIEWYTPPKHLDAVRDVLGGIDLDPASCAYAQQNVLATRYFSTKENGLLQEWHGRIWLNPPYRTPTITHFVAKLIQERDHGRVQAAILLTNCATDTRWFHAAANACDAMCFTRRRINFISANGPSRHPPLGQTFFYLGREWDRFAERFAEFGFIALPGPAQDTMPLLWPRSVA